MKKFRVTGKAEVWVTTVVEAENADEAVVLANETFEGVSGYCGNGGSDKLIGVYGEDSIEAGDFVEFIEAEEVDE